MNKILHILNTKTQADIFPFYIDDHLNHFFSINHENEYTKYNVYSYKSNQSTITKFFKPNGNRQAKIDFINSQPNLSTQQNLKHILSYAIFLYEIDNQIITNLYAYDENDTLYIDIPEPFIDYLIKEEYANNRELFKDILKNFISDKNIINYKNCDLKYKRIIEKDIFNQTNTYYETILTISHNDHNLYHIHRIIINDIY